MALIKRIVTGQTFGNWLDTTNKLIDDLNAANPSRGGNRLVRYDNFGSLSIRDIQANSFFLDSNTSVKIDTLSTDFTNVGFENDNTIFTAAATYAAIKAEQKNIIKDATGHADSPQYVKVNSSNVETRIGGTQIVVTEADQTRFNQNVLVTGNLEVLGDSVEFVTETLTVEDNNITLNRGRGKNLAKNAGFDVHGTDAFFRLVDSGNRFPYRDSSNAVIPMKYRETALGVRNYYVDTTTKTLDDSHFVQAELIGDPEEIQSIEINQKDKLIIQYEFYTTYDPVTNALANNIPLAIGKVSGASRETFVLEPDPDDETSTANSEITYSIDGVYFKTYEDYKNAFTSTEVDSGSVVTIEFDPKNYTQTGNEYFYWAGKMNSYSYVCGTNYNTANRKVDLDIVINNDPATTMSDQYNKNFKIALGDEIRFEIDLTSLLNINDETGTPEREPFYIGTEPFNYQADTSTDNARLDVSKLVFDQVGSNYASAATYEVDGVFYTNRGAYEAAFKNPSSQYANVVFKPEELKYASKYRFYYFNTANNHSTYTYDFGGVIEVSANNTGMGAEITVITQMGLTFNKIITAVGGNLALSGVNNGAITVDAGDTLEFDLTSLSGSGESVKITDASNNLMGENEGVIYRWKNTRYSNYTDFATAFSGSSAGDAATIYITTNTSGSFKYVGSSKAGGNITINPMKASSLSAYHLSTDTRHAAIENPHSFTATKNHNPIMHLDGEIADFRGTKSGILLPADALPTAAQPGTIRYNNDIGLFEGFTNSTWRGLGGVIDLDQDTLITAGDSDNILYFQATAKTVAEMSEQDYWMKSYAKGAEAGIIEVKSNDTPGKFEVSAEGNGNYDGAFTGKSTLTLQPNGLDIDTTGFLRVPIGTVGERPGTPRKGMVRFAEDALQLHTSDTLNGIGDPNLVEALEYYNGTDWVTMTTIKNEFSLLVTTNSIKQMFTNVYHPFDKNEIDIFINGLRIPKVDIKNIVNTASGDYYNCEIEFASQRTAGQLITVIQNPQRYVGTTSALFLTKQELTNGVTDSVNFTGEFRVGSGTDSTDVTSGAIIVDGGVGLSGSLVVGNSLIELSARELKENIQPIDSAMEKISKLNGVEFTWKDQNKSSGYSEIGLIADNVADVIPNLVSFSDNKATGVKYSKIVALLIEAVKEQQHEINELKSQLPKKRVRKTTSKK